MKKKTLIAIASLSVIAGVLITAQPVQAFGFFGGDKSHRGFAHNGHKGGFRNLTDEQKEGLKAQHGDLRQSYLQNLAVFLEIPLEELQLSLENGETLQEIIVDSGKNEAEVQDFLIETKSEKIANLQSEEIISDEKAENILGRIAEFAQRMVSRWFGTN